MDARNLNIHLTRLWKDSDLKKYKLATRMDLTPNYLGNKIAAPVNRAFGHQLLEAMILEAARESKHYASVQKRMQRELDTLDRRYSKDGKLFKTALNATDASASSAAANASKAGDNNA